MTDISRDIVIVGGGPAAMMAGPTVKGGDPDKLLEQVHARRIKPVRRIQALQKLAQDRVSGPLLHG